MDDAVMPARSIPEKTRRAVVEAALTDTIPAEIFEAVTRYYERTGYKLKSVTLATSGTYYATFTK